MAAAKLSLKSVIFFVIFSLSAIAGVHAQTTGGTILDTTKYSVKIPAGWKHFDKSTGQFDALYIMAPPDHNFKPNVNIIMAETGNISMDEFLNGNVDNMKKANMTIDTSGDFETNGLKGKFYTTKVDHGGVTIAIESYLLLKDGIGYVLTGACLATQKATYYPTFEDIVQSFKVK